MPRAKNSVASKGAAQEGAQGGEGLLRPPAAVPSRSPNRPSSRPVNTPTGDRRQRKRQFRALWIVRINAEARQHGLSYSRLIAGLKRASIDMDRRVLADLALHEKDAFASARSAGESGPFVIHLDAFARRSHAAGLLRP